MEGLLPHLGVLVSWEHPARCTAPPSSTPWRRKAHRQSKASQSHLSTAKGEVQIGKRIRNTFGLQQFSSHSADAFSLKRPGIRRKCLLKAEVPKVQMAENTEGQLLRWIGMVLVGRFLLPLPVGWTRCQLLTGNFRYPEYKHTVHSVWRNQDDIRAVEAVYASHPLFSTLKAHLQIFQSITQYHLFYEVLTDKTGWVLAFSLHLPFCFCYYLHRVDRLYFFSHKKTAKKKSYDKFIFKLLLPDWLLAGLQRQLNLCNAACFYLRLGCLSVSPKSGQADLAAPYQKSLSCWMAVTWGRCCFISPHGSKAVLFASRHSSSS